MSTHKADQPTFATVQATITRADGTIEHLGTISAAYSNPLKQLYWKVVGSRLANHRIHKANRSL